MYDFTTAPSREGTNAEKYTLRKQLFGREDVLPVWVADMDLPTPPCVLQAVQERLKHPIIGYEEVPQSAYEAQIAWMKKRHGVEYKKENMFYSHSVVASMHVAIEAFTQKGEGVIVQTPIYPPFFQSVALLERKLVKNPLKYDANTQRYTIDFEDLGKKVTPQTKLLLLCSPHNPVGRVWQKGELEALVAFCKERDIVIFSDEIHADLVYEGHKHIPLYTLKGAKERCVSAIGVGKTFNMAGFAMSGVHVSDPLKQRFQEAYDKVHFAQGNVLSHVAFEAAYMHGEAWLEALLQHLQSNIEKLKQLTQRYTNQIKLIPIEGTYLAWLDCHGMGMKDKDLRQWFIQEAKLGLNPGLGFSKEGSGFMRLNFAISSEMMDIVIQRLQNALERREKNEN